MENKLKGKIMKNVLKIMVLLFLGLNILNANSLNKRTGEVLNYLNAGGYTYIEFKENSEVYWVAIPETELKKNQSITISEQMWMNDFVSKTLNKTFDKILFATYKNNPYSKNDTSKIEKNKSSEHSSFPSLSNILKKTKAEQTATNKAILLTVKKVKENKNQYKDKNIKIKGSVIKVLRGIMKTSWVHIQDENGDSLIFRAKTENLEVGNNVIAYGILNTNVDYGYGYTYETIVVDSFFEKNN